MRRLLMLAAVIAGFTACVNEGVDWNDPTKTSEDVGYLSFDSGGIFVMVDQEAGESEANPQSSIGKRPATRAVSEAELAEYTVQIFDADGVQVGNNFKLGAISTLENYRAAGYTNEDKHDALTTGGLELPVGTYTVRVFSAEAQPVSNKPEYEGTATVRLQKGVATTAEVVCSLSSVKVTVTFDSNMAQVIAPASTSVTARLDEEGVATPSAHTWNGYTNVASLVKDHNAVDAIYLKPQAASTSGTPLNLYLTTLYGAMPDGNGGFTGGSLIKDQKLPVGNVEVGQWRKVTIKLDHGSDGTVYFIVSVENWLYNEEIDVTQSTYAVMLAENEIPDVTDAPVFEAPVGGIDFTQVLALSEEMFENGVYKGNASMTVKTKQPIKAFYLSATSDSEEFAELLSEMGLGATANSEGFEGLNLVGLKNALITNTLSASWGFPVANVEGATEVTFDIKGLLKQLQDSENYAGSHTFAMTVVDAKNNNSTTTLQITSGVEPETSVVWPKHNMTVRYDMTDDLEMVLNIYARGGIKHLWVEIGGEMKEAVEKVGIPAKFDLTNPGYILALKKDENGNPVPDLNDDGSYKYDESGTVAGILTALPTPIPVEDDVFGKKKMAFDITGFKPMLALFKDITADFNVRVVDNEGGEASGAILIKTPAQ